jgi:hypothetical protein
LVIIAIDELSACGTFSVLILVVVFNSGSWRRCPR